MGTFLRFPGSYQEPVLSGKGLGGGLRAQLLGSHIWGELLVGSWNIVPPTLSPCYRLTLILK